MREKREANTMLKQGPIAGESPNPSPLELVKMHGGRSRRVPKKNQAVPDSMLAVYRDRFTYTFILENEVASIHFDRLRNEIFFSGHNIAHMELGKKQQEALKQVVSVLKADERAKELFSAYCATLDRVLADK